MPEIRSKRFDTAIALQVQLLRGSTPVDLTGIALSAIVFRIGGKTAAREYAATTVDDALGGKVGLTPPTELVAAETTHYVEVRVTFLDGKIQTFPLEVADRIIWKVLPSLP